jgi:hypothetical protein
MAELLSKYDIEHFITEGYIRLDNAFSLETANAAVDILWNDIPFDRSDPGTWTEPVVRLGMYTQKPFIDSINSPELYKIFDQLVGAGRWFPCRSVGAFPLRFPSEKIPNDTGKHVDASFPGDDAAAEWRINVKSRGRALLMLILYSDVTENDAPTIIYKRSHIDVARLLHKYGDAGLSFMQLAKKLDQLPERETVYASGKPGTIYLCHPFLVHAAQAHKGNNPRFLAQPPLFLRKELVIANGDVGYAPVEEAIRLGVG